MRVVSSQAANTSHRIENRKYLAPCHGPEIPVSPGYSWSSTSVKPWTFPYFTDFPDGKQCYDLCLQCCCQETGRDLRGHKPVTALLFLTVHSPSQTWGKPVVTFLCILSILYMLDFSCLASHSFWNLDSLASFHFLKNINLFLVASCLSWDTKDLHGGAWASVWLWCSGLTWHVGS